MVKDPFDKSHDFQRKPYDFNNVFWKIIQKQIDAKLIVDSEFSMSFYDINPQANIHVLVIPKNPYSDFSDFHKYASPEEVIDFYNTVQNTVEQLNINEKGFRIENNNGKDANQEVPHFHIHLLQGKK